MKKLVFALIIFCFVQSVFAQDKPLTQTEYVKMLYALQKDPGGKPEIIEALRKRGIDFVLTDGIRSLTRSKGANDEELKRSSRKPTGGERIPFRQNCRRKKMRRRSWKRLASVRSPLSR